MLRPLDFTWSLVIWINLSMIADAGEYLLQPGQTDQFSGATCPLQIDKAAGAADDRIDWRLTSGVRVLAEGHGFLRPVKNRSDAMQLAIQTPEIDNGVVLETELSLIVHGMDSPISFPLRLRGKNPFQSNQKSLEKLGVAIWDPAETTSKRLSQLDLPVRKLRFLRDPVDSAIIILGEDAPWDRDTAARSSELAQQGKFVIALRPNGDSAWSLNLATEGISQFRCLRWHESGMAPAKLDIQSLCGFGVDRPGWEFAIARQNLQLIPRNGPQVFDIVESHTVNHGRCLWIGAPLMSHWDLSPVSREILAHVLVSRINHLSAVATASPK